VTEVRALNPSAEERRDASRPRYGPPASPPERYGAGGLLADLVALQYLGYTATFLIVALASRVGPVAMPQPVLIVPITILAWLGR
jgi:hypothetical protein